MKGKQSVIDVLNSLLMGELAAMDQYFIHSRMYEDFGLSKLYERTAHEMEDETGHADQMIRGALVMPAGTGKDVKVVVITSGENISKAITTSEINIASSIFIARGLSSEYEYSK